MGTKITGLTALTGGSFDAADVFPIVDISDTTQDPSGTTKKTTPDDIVTYVEANATAFEAADVDILKADTADVLAVGFQATAHVLTEDTSATLDPDNGNYQIFVNSDTVSTAAATLTMPTTSEIADGDAASICLLVQNGATVTNAVAFAGITNGLEGDTPDTTANGEWLISIDLVRKGADVFVRANSKALQ